MSFLKKFSFGKNKGAEDAADELIAESQAINTDLLHQIEPSVSSEIADSIVAESVVAESVVGPAPESVLPDADQLAESILVSEAHPAMQEFAPAKAKKGLFGFFKRSKAAEGDLEAEALEAMESVSGVDESTLGSVGETDNGGVSQAILDDPMAGLNLDDYANFGLDDLGVDVDSIAPAAAAATAAVLAGVTNAREAEIINEIGPRPRELPVIGKLPAKTQYALSFGLLAVSLALAGGIAGVGFTKASEYQNRSEIGTRVQMLTQRMLATSQYATAGSKDAVARLQESRKDVEAQFVQLVGGTQGMPGMSEQDNANLRKAKAAITAGVFPLVDQVIALSASVGDLAANVAALNKATGSLAAESERLVVLLQSTGAPVIQVSAADHVRILTERLHRNGGSMLASSEVSDGAFAEFGRDFRDLSTTLATLTKGDADLGIAPVSEAQARKIVDSLGVPMAEIARVADYLQKNAQPIVNARRSLATLSAKSEEALNASAAFSSEMRTVSSEAYSTVYFSAILLALALASLALIGLVNNRITRADAWQSAFRNKRNEKEIIDFMEACLPLEMGNLTVRFNDNLESMEGITGGIRNSVNEAVISLNDAVGTVKRTAEEVSNVVTQSVLSTSDMKVSNERQTMEITEVEGRVAGLTAAISDVTERTLDAARATEMARNASEEGAKVVAQTNEKMGVIRQNMQEVLKSVKHLGETSHEIGDIVSTIEQITDRTQVLAVNASLEAAKAGAAGAGFQIIAGEVNRLAEQSAEALRTITALVQRVQGETGMTIKVVEESTSNVVEGARLSEHANTQLVTISKLAGDLSQIMGEIRTQSEGQTTNAKEVRESMERLAELSREFHAQVAQVVGGVEQIDASMSSLKNTVSIFTTEKAAQA